MTVCTEWSALRFCIFDLGHIAFVLAKKQTVQIELDQGDYQVQGRLFSRGI